MQTLYRPLIALLLMLAIAGCATLNQDLDPPKVTLESFRSAPGQEGAPRFEIKLRIMNPNNMELDIAGISYDIELLGREVISGVSDEVPKIGPYSEDVVTLQASLQLFELLRLFTSLGTSGDGPLEYKFSAKIDFNGFVPTQRIEEVGEIALN